MDDVVCMWMIMLELGVVNIANDDEYFYTMTLTYMNPTSMFNESMLGVSVLILNMFLPLMM